MPQLVGADVPVFVQVDEAKRVLDLFVREGRVPLALLLRTPHLLVVAQLRQLVVRPLPPLLLVLRVQVADPLFLVVRVHAGLVLRVAHARRPLELKHQVDLPRGRGRRPKVTLAFDAHPRVHLPLFEHGEQGDGALPNQVVVAQQVVVVNLHHQVILVHDVQHHHLVPRRVGAAVGDDFRLFLNGCGLPVHREHHIRVLPPRLVQGPQPFSVHHMHFQGPRGQELRPQQQVPVRLG
mmetsp:Transcript_33002/g.65745  ORF Transcript_33002/g.65745 Transcript_33002/m.65745 type:complete len:236 (+) Transcript_33002:273-980(+)